MIVHERDQQHQHDADSQPQELLIIQLGSGAADSNQTAVIERAQQRYHEVIKFPE